MRWSGKVKEVGGVRGTSEVDTDACEIFAEEHGGVDHICQKGPIADGIEGELQAREELAHFEVDPTRQDVKILCEGECDGE